MLKEVVTTGKSIEEAVARACSQLGVAEEKCSVEVLEKPKKSFFGRLKAEAKVKVTVKEKVIVEVPKNSDPVQTESAIKPAAPKTEAAAKDEAEIVKDYNSEAKLEAAVTYLKEVLNQMGLTQVEVTPKAKTDGAVLSLTGENLGILIGRHGETLDSLQYLTSLVCNRVEGSYYRLTLDCGNYREKREEALKELAKKISEKVKRTGRSQMLEPMNPYERRIIHAIISDIDGVTSKSKGEEPNRRIVILPTSKNGTVGASRHKGSSNRGGGYQKRPQQPERTMEQILKGEVTEAEKNTKRYSKIEL